MRRAGALALVAAAALGASCAHLQARDAAPEVAFVERDVVWSGDVRIDGIVHIRKGVTLTIRPGTRVLFAPARFGEGDEHEGFTGPGLKVDGRIVAEGTEEEPIVFTAAGGASPGIWDKILFSFSTGNRFVHCTFEGARYAFHAHFSEISVRRCLFRDNEEGVRLGQSRVTIEDSVFTRNAVRGINFRECRNEIRGNLIFDNGDGIFLHSKDSASVIRGNAVYGNREFNLRLGDLHVEDFDASGNWWGTAREDEARRTVSDGRKVAGVGSVRLSPVLTRPPVAGATIRGFVVNGDRPVQGAVVRAYTSVADGFWKDESVAEAAAGADGWFAMPVPPGRYFVVGRAEMPDGILFAFPGRNPVSAALGEMVEIALPSVVASPPPVSSPTGGLRPSLSVRATCLGKPVAGVSVRAFRPQTPDFRGPGEASAVTNDEGVATLVLPPGRYVVAAKKRTTEESLGTVDEGGLFGVYPHSPVALPPAMSVAIEIPLFEKRGWLGGEDVPTEAPGPGIVGGTALLGGKPAEGYFVYFYRSPETIGRPVRRSSVVSPAGAFGVSLPEPGVYLAYLRKSVPGAPGEAEEERIGPVSVRFEGGRFLSLPLSFGPLTQP